MNNLPSSVIAAYNCSRDNNNKNEYLNNDITYFMILKLLKIILLLLYYTFQSVSMRNFQGLFGTIYLPVGTFENVGCAQIKKKKVCLVHLSSFQA